jgi:peptide/nickel transport system permease protein
MASAQAVARLDDVPEDEGMRRRTHLQRAVFKLRRDYLTQIALLVVILLTGLSFAAPLFANFVVGVDFNQNNLRYTFLPPDSFATWRLDGEQVEIYHMLGTDELGRDHFIRLLYGGQVSIMIAVFAAGLSLGIGVFLGMLTGFYGGVVDDFFIWLITTINSIPSLFLLLIVSALLGPGPVGLILILGGLGWTGTMRLVRGETLSLREREYIVAARAMGAPNLRIMTRHIFPNIISIVIIILALDIGVLILIESALSFLGFGIQPPIPSWGNMLTEAQSYFRKAPHLVILPGVLITTTVLALYVIGDGIRDALDPTIGD